MSKEASTCECDHYFDPSPNDITNSCENCINKNCRDCELCSCTCHSPKEATSNDKLKKAIHQSIGGTEEEWKELQISNIKCKVCKLDKGALRSTNICRTCDDKLHFTNTKSNFILVGNKALSGSQYYVIFENQEELDKFLELHGKNLYKPNLRIFEGKELKL